MVLKSHDLLTVNATIIAGLMILLSIQIVNPIDTLLNQQNSLYQKATNLQLTKERLSTLLNSNFSTNKNVSIDPSELKSSLTAKVIELKETEIELNQTQEQLKNPDKVQSYVAYHQYYNSTIEKIVNMMMMLPFIISAAYESYTTYRMDFGESANKISVIIMFMGFVFLIAGLYVKLAL